MDIIQIRNSINDQTQKCSGNGEGDGAEDEQAPIQSNEHVKRDSTDEQVEASQYTEVGVLER